MKDELIGVCDLKLESVTKTSAGSRNMAEMRMRNRDAHGYPDKSG